jgi:hypothetical protein
MNEYQKLPFYQLEEDRVQLGRELRVHNNNPQTICTVIVNTTNKKEKCI